MSSKVKKGQLTYDAEGIESPKSSKYFSRVIHWPGNTLSGVTIGRGYDMGNRTKAAIKTDMTNAGVPLKKATELSEAAGLKGLKAKEFIKNNKDSIGEITLVQQVKLFDTIYPKYERLAQKNYEKWTASKKAVAWTKLDQIIRDVLVDFVYQGFTKGPRPMLAGMNNDFNELIHYIENTPAIKQYETGRKRARYLKSHRPAKVEVATQ